MKFVTAAFQSIALVQAHRGSKLHSIGLVIPIVAVTKKLSLPAIGPQYGCPQRHLSASWTSKSVIVMLRLLTNRSIVCTLCVRLLHAMFASSRSCVFSIYFSKLSASLSCFLPGCRVLRMTFASPPAITRASGCSLLACVRALDHAAQYAMHAAIVLLFEFTGPYHAPIIREVLGRWMIQKPDCWGAFGMWSLVLDSRRLWLNAAPVPFPGRRFGSLLYSNMYGASGGSDVASEGCISRTRLGPLQIASMRLLLETICNS